MIASSEKLRGSGILRETNAELSLRQYGMEECAPGHSFQGVRNHWLLHLVLQGRGRYSIAGQTFEVETGGAFLIPPGVENSYCADSTDPWKYYWIGFSGTQAPMLLRAAGFRDGRYVLPLKNTEALVSIIAEIPDYDKADYAQRFIAQGYLYMFLGLLVRENGENHFWYSPLVADALDYVHTHYGEPMTVDGLAARVGASRTTLYRAFRRECGVSPQEYVVDYRLKSSVTAFDSAKSLAEIAFDCGFNNYAYYSEAFRKKYGKSPAEYRKNLLLLKKK